MDVKSLKEDYARCEIGDGYFYDVEADNLLKLKLLILLKGGVFVTDSGFVLADIDKLVQFEKKSEEAIEEFDAIKKEFERINETLLSKWKGEGADAYRQETDNILANIGGIRDVLDAINNGAVKAIKESYLKLDEELGKFNRNPHVDREDG